MLGDAWFAALYYLVVSGSAAVPANTPPAKAGGVELRSMCAWLVASHVAVSMFTPNVVLICYAIPWVSEPWAVSFQFSDDLGEFPQWAL